MQSQNNSLCDLSPTLLTAAHHLKFLVIVEQALQKRLSGSMSTTLPLTTDIATTSFIEEYPLRCHVPSTVTPMSVVSGETLHNSAADAFIDTSAISLSVYNFVGNFIEIWLEREFNYYTLLSIGCSRHVA